jgi:hypothetical protein
LQKISDFRKNQHFFCKNPEISQIFSNFCDFLQNFATSSKNQLDSFVDLEKPEKMRIWLQNFVSIQPRTSLEKSDVAPSGLARSRVIRLERSPASPPISPVHRLFLRPA